MNKAVDPYYDLLDVPDVLSVASKYVAYSKCGLYYDFGHTILRAGTKLYRVRRNDGKTDFSDKTQWDPAPSRPKNRCNRKGEPALYLGSDKTICMLETDIQPGESCAVGTYICNKDIALGGFVYVEPTEPRSKQLAGIILNALLIAPSRNSNNKELFQYLESIFPNIDLCDIRPRDDLLIPFEMAVVNQKQNYYQITNQLCDILKLHHPEGIRYSSCYAPMETVGIKCSAYNVVLYNAAISKMTFESYEITSNSVGITAKGFLQCIDWEKLKTKKNGVSI